MSSLQNLRDNLELAGTHADETSGNGRTRCQLSTENATRSYAQYHLPVIGMDMGWLLELNTRIARRC